MRVLEFLRNGLDKKALRLAKRKVRSYFLPPGPSFALLPVITLPMLTQRFLFAMLKVGTHQRGKKKREELTRVIAAQNLAKAKAKN